MEKLKSHQSWGELTRECFAFIPRFFAVNAGVVYLYFALYQKVDEDEFGGTWELIKEGFVTSFALFLVSTDNMVLNVQITVGSCMCT